MFRTIRFQALLVGLMGLASGCQSTRPTFSFQSAARQGQPMVSAVSLADEASAVVAIAPVPAATVASNTVKTVIYPRRRPAPRPPAATVPTTITFQSFQLPATAHRRAWLARPQAPAEAGLGTTVLGVLGLITLPIALLGLLLSGGGLVWGIVAGLAALAVLVAYLDPFGG